MFGTHSTDVLVVGAGPVGLTTALCLAQENIRVRIIDEEFRPAAHSYALALHPGTLELLAPLGVTPALVPHGRRVHRIALHGLAGEQAEISLERLPGNYPFALVLPQSELEGRLEKQLHDHHVDVQWNHRLSELARQPADAHPGDCLVSTIERLARATAGYAVSTPRWVIEKTSRLRSAFVAGADGCASSVRQHLQASFEEVGPAEIFAVFELEIDRDPGSVMHLIVDGHSTSVMWPLPGSRCRWSFQLADAQVAPGPRRKSRLALPVAGSAFPHLSDETLHHLLQSRAPWFDADIKHTDWAISVRFERRLAEPFGRGRCWLAGDAAHLTGPAGVHSANAGLHEARHLATHLQDVLLQNKPLDDLHNYDALHRRTWRHLLGLEGGLVATPQTPPWLTQQTARLLPCIPASGADLNAAVEQIGMKYV